MITFNNGSQIQPICATNNTEGKRGKRSKLFTHYCPACNAIHTSYIADTYFLKGEWYCKRSVDKLNGEGE